MIAYLAGPMRGYPNFNFPAFDSAAACLRNRGWTIFSPAERDREHGFDPTLNTLEGFDVEEALAADFRMILDSDAIVLLNGWEKSTGARAERFVAEMTGRQVWRFDRGWVWRIDHGLDRLGDADSWNGDPRVEAKVREEDVDVAVRNGAEWKRHQMRKDPMVTLGALEREAIDRAMFPEVNILDEFRVTNPTTGGEKGQKVERHDLIPVAPLKALATHYGIGARKYADRNWERGYEWSLSYGALQRHLTAFWNGEDIDEETQSPHLAAVAFHTFALMEFGRTHPEMDDRPSRD